MAVDSIPPGSAGYFPKPNLQNYRSSSTIQDLSPKPYQNPQISYHSPSSELLKDLSSSNQITKFASSSLTNIDNQAELEFPHSIPEPLDKPPLDWVNDVLRTARRTVGYGYNKQALGAA